MKFKLGKKEHEDLRHSVGVMVMVVNDSEKVLG